MPHPTSGNPGQTWGTLRKSYCFKSDNPHPARRGAAAGNESGVYESWRVGMKEWFANHGGKMTGWDSVGENA